MSIKVSGMDTFDESLGKLADSVDRINAGALGEGAGYVADQLKAALETMPTHDDGEYGTESYKLVGATKSEKQQIISNFGIARHKTSGSVRSTAIGFHGYVSTPSTKWHGQVPTGILMQCIEYGNEFRQALHLISAAERKVKDTAVSKMQDYIDSEIARKDL